MTGLLRQLRHWAEKKPDSPAFMFASRAGVVEQSLTFAELLARAGRVAAALQDRRGRGERALVIFRPGAEFMIGLLGCLLAGVIAVPIPPPRRTMHRDSADAIAANAKPGFALSETGALASLRSIVAGRPAWQSLQWIAIDSPGSVRSVSIDDPGDVAFLQYTSGSTSRPQGAVVSHANLASNLAMMQAAFRTSSESVFSCWLPLFHDMGLVGNALHAIHAGSCCILMAPNDFMMRPQSWLKVISGHKVDFAGGPNFAFDHCVDRYRPSDEEKLDLSSWRVAFNGAEPVKAGTLDRFVATFERCGFAAKSFFPCYGMAEATVMVSGKRDPGLLPIRCDREGNTQIGCGPALPGEDLAIVDPTDARRLPAAAIGEIWLRGPNIVSRYWDAEGSSRRTFGATIAGETGRWMRTGDLGFVDETGELFVTGRLKELIIIRGHNHYPHDIEWTVRECHPAFQNQMSAAFAVESVAGPSVVVLQELDRTWRRAESKAELERAVREAVTLEHAVAVDRVVILPAGSIPRTTSGKVQRLRARDLWLGGAYQVDRADAG